VNGPQQLQVVVTDACGNTLIGAVQLALEVPPAIDLHPVIAEGCAPLTVTMPSFSVPPGTTFLWDLGNGSVSTQATPTVTYPAGSHAVGLSIATPLGCTYTAPTSGLVLAHPSPTAAFTASIWNTDADHATIHFTDQSTGAHTWSWTFGDGGTSGVQHPVHTYMAVGTFPVTLWVQNQWGCTDEVTHTVTITPVYDVTVPTAFTPNPNGGNGGQWVPDDLSNDVFYPFIRFVDEYRMRIFNRWGELIFESDDLRIGWDGYYRGQLSPQDVYIVQLFVRFIDGKEIRKHSDLTLLR
jgi:gliding motility-associated-like protein